MRFCKITNNPLLVSGITHLMAKWWTRSSGSRAPARPRCGSHDRDAREFPASLAPSLRHAGTDLSATLVRDGFSRRSGGPAHAAGGRCRGVELLGLVDDPAPRSLLASRLVDPAGKAASRPQALGCAAACDARLRGDAGDEPLDILRARLAELIAGRSPVTLPVPARRCCCARGC